MINSKDFLVHVIEIAAEEPGYQPGYSGDDHLCDCIGLVIGALRRCGYRWPGIHGSNWAARNAVERLFPVSSASVLSPGDLVFKTRSPGQQGYALPDRYAGHPDRQDYYHVGVVLSARPLRIRHMTDPSPRVDTSIGKWSHFGQLICLAKDASDVSESSESTHIPSGKENAAMSTPIVVRSDNGAPVKLRKKPSASSSTWWDIPSGTPGTLLTESGSWSQIETTDTGGKLRSGWMQSHFVSGDTSNRVDPLSALPPPASVSASDTVRILEILAHIEKQLDTLCKMAGGRG